MQPVEQINKRLSHLRNRTKAVDGGSLDLLLQADQFSEFCQGFTEASLSRMRAPDTCRNQHESAINELHSNVSLVMSTESSRKLTRESLAQAPRHPQPGGSSTSAPVCIFFRYSDINFNIRSLNTNTLCQDFTTNLTEFQT